MKAIKLPRVRIILLMLCFLLAGKTAYLQNVGIGIAQPQTKLQVAGSFIAGTAFKGSASAPDPQNQLNMINGQTIRFENDSVARFYDPGGPAGNYLPGMTANVRCSSWVGNYGNAYLEITIESLQLGTGDSLKISDDFSQPFYRIGNTSLSSPVVIHSSSAQVNFNFQSNADASTGAGFSVKIRMMYPDINAGDNSYTTGYGMAFHSNDQSIRLGKLNQVPRGNRSVGIGDGAVASGANSISMGANSLASGSNSFAVGESSVASFSNAVAIGGFNEASGNAALALGPYSNATATQSIAMGGANAEAANSIAIGQSAVTEGSNTIALGAGTRAIARYSTTIGRFNFTSASENPSSWVDTDPLFTIGNGSSNNDRSNAFFVRKDGLIGIGTNSPASDLHIRQSSGGGLTLQNAADGNKWRIYSASGDNNLTFYNNANVEVADIHATTGAYNAISDARLKKNVQPLQQVLPLLMQLVPASYHFNWQAGADEKQIGLIAQEAHRLFPELVSYDSTKDLYKINYAGFSTVAIKAIQEQQSEIELLKSRLAAIEAKLRQ
ncbi:MAG: tail fiber domain-containing protein [Rhizobacter sp.]|nr:tail fiber domain-containing protein [Ferruginibacter sp.]